ncbi:VWA domain-containing protein [Leekyejoonella antrihumi]|uniref:VWA domain-containing protein n=1 Tax=Leekyejoonella antrihumi TaxID=1660198 RepID=A0A563E856_9MICO|nr:VWA domain-containing protein [Leekyejoonella antrihumi]TWP38625.1 VWA domain-containing protein [Leekyejoonella antrihumi]
MAHRPPLSRPGSPLRTAVALARTPDGKASVATLWTWHNLAKDARMLVLVDVSGSMSDQMDPNRPGTSRIDVLRGLELGALSTMPRSTEIGAWAFSTNLRGPGKDWKPLSKGIHPVGPPGRSNTFRQALVGAVGEMPKLVARNGDTALYDSVWAAYAEVSRTYDPAFVDSVVVLTDGKNEDPNGGLDLSQLLTRLKTAYNPQKPVKIVTISIGDGTDPAALQQIATTTNGLSYRPRSADQITSVFIDAFLHRN